MAAFRWWKFDLNKMRGFQAFKSMEDSGKTRRAQTNCVNSKLIFSPGFGGFSCRASQPNSTKALWLFLLSKLCRLKVFKKKSASVNWGYWQLKQFWKIDKWYFILNLESPHFCYKMRSLLQNCRLVSCLLPHHSFYWRQVPELMTEAPQFACLTVSCCISTNNKSRCHKSSGLWW